MTTIEKVEAYLLITVDEDFRDEVQGFIDSVTAYIEKYTGRTFTPITEETEATEKIYDGSNSGELFIDDAVEIESIVVDGEELEETDYKLYPANGLPKTRIIMPYRIFREDAQNVVVNAKWGYGEAVPADLEFAATLLVADMINASNTTGAGDVVSESIGRYSVTYSTGSNSSEKSSEALKAHKILNLYRRMT